MVGMQETSDGSLEAFLEHLFQSWLQAAQLLQRCERAQAQLEQQSVNKRDTSMLHSGSSERRRVRGSPQLLALPSKTTGALRYQ